MFSPNGLISGVYTVDYSLSGCTDDMEITILEINAGEDISACPNAPIFNLNSSLTTPGGTWSGNGIQSNGDINVGSSVTTIPAIYTLLNGCSDTILVNVDGINVQVDDTICQNSGIYTLNFSPLNGVWSVPPVNPLINSNCITSINNFPYQIGWESGFNNWSNDPSNDFDWSINNGGTPSVRTGPSSAIQGLSYVYTEALDLIILIKPLFWLVLVSILQNTITLFFIFGIINMVLVKEVFLLILLHQMVQTTIRMFFSHLVIKEINGMKLV